MGMIDGESKIPAYKKNVWRMSYLLPAMPMFIKRRFPKAALVMLTIALLTACSAGIKPGTGEPSQGDGITVYYVNNDKTTLLSTVHIPACAADDTQALVEEMLTVLQTNPVNLATAAPISGNCILRDYGLEDTVLTLSFDILYGMQDEVGEILNRAAIVRTLLQIEGVENILFLVDGTALMKTNGEPVGVMNAQTFLFNAGSELHTYDRVRLLLYFANEAGDSLIPVYRTMIYNSNMSMERLVVEQMIMGPQTEGVYATVSPETKLINVSLQDGICYVDLNEAFISTTLNVSADVTIYSLVNSLTELAGVSRVQITVNGQVPASLDAQSLLGTPLERYSDLIENR